MSYIHHYHVDIFPVGKDYLFSDCNVTIPYSYSNRSVVKNNDGSYSLKGIAGVIYGPCDYEAEALPSSRHPRPEDALFVDQTAENVELPKANINKNYVLSPIGQESDTLEDEQCRF